jgi:hypothetical protein
MLVQKTSALGVERIEVVKQRQHIMNVSIIFGWSPMNLINAGKQNKYQNFDVYSLLLLTIAYRSLCCFISISILLHVYSVGCLVGEQIRTEKLLFRDEFDDVFSVLLVKIAHDEEQAAPFTTTRPLPIVLSATGDKTTST